MDAKFKIAALAESMDPVEMMEKKLGKRWDQFTEAEQMQMLMFSANIFEAQREANELAGDTSMRTSFESAEQMLISLGFQLGWMKWRDSPKWGYREKETIYCRPDGLVVYMETYHGTSLNEIDLFGEIKPNFEIKDYYYNASLICSGGGSYGMYPSGMDIPVEKKNIEFSADCRNGLRRRIQSIADVGTLIPIWENTSKFLWFLNYDEEKFFQHDEHKEMSLAKIREGAPMLKTIFKNFL